MTRLSKKVADFLIKLNKADRESVVEFDVDNGENAEQTLRYLDKRNDIEYVQVSGTKYMAELVLVETSNKVLI